MKQDAPYQVKLTREQMEERRRLAGSKNLKVYSTPKHGRRDDEAVYLKLGKTTYAIFIAYDQLRLDKDTAEELKFLKKNKVPIYFVIPREMEQKIENRGFRQNARVKIYSYKQGDINALKQILNTLMLEMTANKDNELGLWDLIILVGLILLVIYLISDEGNKG